MIETLTLQGALHVIKNMRKADRDCLEALAPKMSDEYFALSKWQTNGAAWQVVQNGEAVAIAGIMEVAPWHGVAWMVSTDKISRDSYKNMIRFTKVVFDNASDQYQRLEATVLGTWTQAEKYARHLGFVHEGTRCKAGRDCQDVLVFIYEKPKD